VDVGELVFSLEYEPHCCNHCFGSEPQISFFFRCHVRNDIQPQKPSHTDINPDDPTITSIAKWIPITDLRDINVVPKIAAPLIKYIETGTFTPSFWAESEQM